jgi:hypothetical protein
MTLRCEPLLKLPMAVYCGSYGDTILDIVRNLVPTGENNYGLD